ncbi:MAG: recombination mediator RecR [Patescibacteria group bacterium]
MAKYPPTMQRLIEEFSMLPTIGPKTAERFVLYLLRHQGNIDNLTSALAKLKSQVVTCQICQTFSEKSPCYICSNPKRDQSVVCVVAQTTDLAVIESTGQYNGLYHVLGDTIDLGNENSPMIDKLVNRLKQQPQIKEVILAFSPDIEGESTILYLNKVLKPLKFKTTRLARGLSMGSDLAYADEITLSSALEGRREI